MKETSLEMGEVRLILDLVELALENKLLNVDRNVVRNVSSVYIKMLDAEQELLKEARGNKNRILNYIGGINANTN